MTDKQYIQRNAPTREQRRQRDIRRNLVILGVALVVLVALLLLLGAGTVEEPETLADKPVVVTVAPVDVPTIKLAPASDTESPITPTPHYPMTDEERDLVERVVHAESSNQSLTAKWPLLSAYLTPP